jgi:glutathione S-transferase
MFFEQYSHEPHIAVVRFWRHFLTELTPLQELDLPERLKKGYAALDVMEQHLALHPFFVDGRYGLADIALYGYTHVAHEGEFDLSSYPHIRAWLARVAQQPGHVPMIHEH